MNDLLQKLLRFFRHITQSVFFFLRELGTPIWIVLGFSSIVWFAFLEPDLSNFTVVPVDRPDFAFEDVVFSHIVSGELTWSFKASTAAIDKVIRRATLENVDGMFFQNDQVVLTVQSPRGLLNMDSSKLFLKSAVIFYSVDGRDVTLKATELNWYPDEKKFKGTGKVVVFSGPVQLEGESFLVDLVAKKVVLSESSRASIQEEL